MTEPRAPYGANQPPDLPAIEARLAAATPGPWRRLVDGDAIWAGNVYVALVRNSDGVYHHPNAPESQEAADNANLIAHAPADIAALVTEVKRLRLQVAQLAEALEAWVR